ncbi:MAG: enolase C-terminal domain-like protein [Reyranellaceae bacterium]
MASLSNAPRLRVKEIEFFEWPYTLRLPFRFGVITVTHGRQVVARARIELADGRSGWGIAAEALGAKWFDKDPAISDEDNLDQLRLALEIARGFYLAQGSDTAFGHFAAAYRPQIDTGARHRLNPLVASYGPAMIDRCVIDALGKIVGRSFQDMIRANLPGIEPGRVVSDLDGFDFGRFLAELKPLPKLHVRHTVGMVDPIVASDQAPGTRVNDGLPETLEEIVAHYGQTYFKLKVGGDLEKDVARLTAIASVLDRIATPYRATLDGNEQYADAQSVLELWNAIAASPKLQRLKDSILFIEQPIKRQMALAQDVAALAAERPVILDESDGDLDAFPTGRRLGYAGISSKNCKGFYKSILNRARCAHWNAHENTDRYFMSAEDLTTLAGISVQQDMALVALLGLTHVERNGHHFINGMSGRPVAEQQAFLKAHPGLYYEADGVVRLKIDHGMVDLASLDCPGFAIAAEPQWTSLEEMPASKWR